MINTTTTTTNTTTTTTTTTMTTNKNNQRLTWRFGFDFCRFYNTYLQFTGDPKHSISRRTLTQKFKAFCAAHGSKSQLLHDRTIAESISFHLSSFGVRLIPFERQGWMDYTFVGLRYKDPEEAETKRPSGDEKGTKKQLKNTRGADIGTTAKDVLESFKMEGSSEQGRVSGTRRALFPPSTVSPPSPSPLPCPLPLPTPGSPHSSLHPPFNTQNGTSSPLHLPSNSRAGSPSSFHLPSNPQTPSLPLSSDSQTSPPSIHLPSNPQTLSNPLPFNSQSDSLSFHLPSKVQTLTYTSSSTTSDFPSLPPVYPSPQQVPNPQTANTCFGTPLHAAPPPIQPLCRSQNPSTRFGIPLHVAPPPVHPPCSPQNPRAPPPIISHPPPLPLAPYSTSYILFPSCPQLFNPWQQYHEVQAAANTYSSQLAVNTYPNFTFNFQDRPQFNPFPLQTFYLQPATPLVIPSFPTVPPPLTPPPFLRPPQTVTTPLPCPQYTIPPPSSPFFTIPDSPVSSPCFPRIPPPFSPRHSATTSGMVNTPPCSPVPPHFPSTRTFPLQDSPVGV